MPPRRRRGPERLGENREGRTRAQRARDFATGTARGQSAGQRIQNSFRAAVRGVQQSRATQATNLITGQGPRRAPVRRSTGQSLTSSQAARARRQAQRLAPGSYNVGRARRVVQARLARGEYSRADRRVAQSFLANSSSDTR